MAVATGFPVGRVAVATLPTLYPLSRQKSCDRKKWRPHKMYNLTAFFNAETIMRITIAISSGGNFFVTLRRQIFRGTPNSTRSVGGVNMTGKRPGAELMKGTDRNSYRAEGLAPAPSP